MSHSGTQITPEERLRLPNHTGQGAPAIVRPIIGAASRVELLHDATAACFCATRCNAAAVPLPPVIAALAHVAADARGGHRAQPAAAAANACGQGHPVAKDVMQPKHPPCVLACFCLCRALAAPTAAAAHSSKTACVQEARVPECMKSLSTGCISRNYLKHYTMGSPNAITFAQYTCVYVCIHRYNHDINLYHKTA